MKKIVVPEGMMKAAKEGGLYYDAGSHRPAYELQIESSLKAAVRWMSENPMVPAPGSMLALIRELGIDDDSPMTANALMIVEAWQRRMFYRDPDVPAEVKDLLWSGKVITPRDESIEECDRRILEAYRRGLASNSGMEAVQ